MIQMRRGLYETNSSSVHVFVIPKEQSVHIPKSVHLRGGEYGWSKDTVCDTLNYFYQACLDMGKEEVDKLFNYLKRKGVEEIDAPEIQWKKSKWNDEDYYYAENNNGYVDHCGEVPFNDLFANEDLLDRFLFGEDSFVVTGNDNDFDERPDEEDYNSDENDIIVKDN